MGSTKMASENYSARHYTDKGISEERAISSCTGGSDRAFALSTFYFASLLFCMTFGLNTSCCACIRRYLRGKGHIFLYRRFGPCLYLVLQALILFEYGVGQWCFWSPEPTAARPAYMESTFH